MARLAAPPRSPIVARIAALIACSLVFAAAIAGRAEATPTLVAGDQVSLVGIEGDAPAWIGHHATTRRFSRWSAGAPQ